MFRRVSDAKHQYKLDAACKWLGIDRGRAAQYGRLLKEFSECDQKEDLTGEHFLAYAESCQVIDLFEMWEHGIANFPGLQGKLRAALSKGPVVSEDERTAASSNRARNDAFVYFVAGTFLKAGIPVLAVDSIPALCAMCSSDADFTFECNGTLIDVECKRPQSDSALVKNVNKARRQIMRRDGRHGVIALDCSVFLRPAWRFLEGASPQAAESTFSLELRERVSKKIVRFLTNSILGFILFARFPMMTRMGDGKQSFRRDCISTWLLVRNSDYAGNPQVLQCVARRLDQAVPTS